jgi:hypothetical protein
MLKICKQVAADCLAARIRIRIRWIPSEVDPSDFDSRHIEGPLVFICRLPAMALPRPKSMPSGLGLPSSAAPDRSCIIRTLPRTARPPEASAGAAKSAASPRGTATTSTPLAPGAVAPGVASGFRRDLSGSISSSPAPHSATSGRERPGPAAGDPSAGRSANQDPGGFFASHEFRSDLK